MSRVLGVLAAAMLLVGTAAGVAGQVNLQCQRCHGELELIRQHVRSLPDARRMLVLQEDLAGSAHGGMGCVECHTGFARFPHPDAAQTRSCESCHEAAAGDWRRGAHAGLEGPLGVEGGEPVTCTQCHGVHTVADVASLEAGPALTAMNERCTSCHETQRLPPDDPHRAADEVGCHSCHAPHDVRPPRDPDSWMAAHRQEQVCGACHQETAERWRSDVHGQALLATDPEELDIRYGAAGPPTCSTCHGSHPIARAGERGFSVAAVERCVSCHQHAGATFFGTYHGKATALGSVISASCVDCHSAHQIYPASDPRSTVAPQNLVATCQTCHEYARPAFVLYDSHPEPFNRHRNPYIFYSFWFMNSLLIGTLTVFGFHTLMWWVRIELDRRRGIVHGPGQSHGHGQGQDRGPEGNDDE
jgi:hypothetical protein